MSDVDPDLADYIAIGEVLHHLRNPQVATINNYADDVDKFFTLLRRCVLTQTQTAAEQIYGARLLYSYRTGRITPSHIAQLQILMESISRVLYNEASSKSVIITDAQDIPRILVELHTRLGVANLEPHQEALRQDVITCFKAQAYRPAIVISWALGFDLVRWWIYSDATRLSDFNQLLAQRTQRVRQRQIVNYHDFFAENESSVLAICRDSTSSLQSFTSKTYRQLESLLDDRNAFAHANYADATESESKSYIERLLRVLTTSPFV